MKELVEQVEKLVAEEGTRSMIEHPLFNSTHEGYAVIKEEIEETEYELNVLNEMLEGAWRAIKDDRQCDGHMIEIKKRAINTAAEAIQTAAMAQKCIDSFEAENE